MSLLLPLSLRASAAWTLAYSGRHDTNWGRMLIIGGLEVWFDMAEHVIAPGDLAAVIDPYTQAPTLFQHPRPDAEWPERPRRPRRVMMPTAPTIPGVVREWSETIVMGRVIATRRVPS